MLNLCLTVYIVIQVHVTVVLSEKYGMPMKLVMESMIAKHKKIKSSLL